MTHVISDEAHEQLMLQRVRDYFYQIPFNKVLGLAIRSAQRDRFEIDMPMRSDLVGNHHHQILHGGVISSILDVAGGCMVALGLMDRVRDMTEEKRMQVLSKIGTIDLRVDFLRPGRGTAFVASAVLLRSGNKVGVTRMELHNDGGELLATGTGTYLCG